MDDVDGSFSFVSNWFEKFKDLATSPFRVEFTFSEGLLRTLYYDTDIGSIPRGVVADKYHLKYKNNPNCNWNKRIIGCYWCERDKTAVEGICCSKECIYYLHEWCVERVELFQERRFCKLPGCDRSPGDKTHVCCSRSHNIEYVKLYAFINKDQLRSLMAKGPSWYNSEKSFESSSVIQNTLSTFVNSAINTATMDLAKELKFSLIFYTDVGPIPRPYKTIDHIAYQYSTHKNWVTHIKGCYYCGNIVTDKFEYLCSRKCYIIFHEWSRHKILEFHRVEFCEYPGCGKISEKGYSTCDKFHFNKKDKFLQTDEGYKLIQKGPHWYNTPSTNTSSVSTGSVATHTKPDKRLNLQNTINIPSSSGPVANKLGQNSANSPTYSHPESTRVPNFFRDYLVLSLTLTEWLYKESDIGPIPRTLIDFPQIAERNIPTASNWNTIIPACYWCCAGDQSYKSITCSEKCFFLFNEWCHKKYNKSTYKIICKICGDSLFFKKDCCFGTHAINYNSYSKYSYLLGSNDYALGPQWYSDTHIRHIDFYNREDPFYEFTNFFPCPRLKLDKMEWKTTEHYFQAQKFVGTPHVECVRRLNSPRDAFQYTRRPEVQKWVRLDWAKIKEDVMLKALEAKFNQNEELAHLLIRTGDIVLYEHTRNDKFWGDGGDRKGENRLGKLLTQVRFDLQKRCPFLPSRMEHTLTSISNTYIPNANPSAKDVHPIQTTNSSVDSTKNPNPAKLAEKNSTGVVMYSNIPQSNKGRTQSPNTSEDKSCIISTNEYPGKKNPFMDNDRVSKTNPFDHQSQCSADQPASDQLHNTMGVVTRQPSSEIQLPHHNSSKYAGDYNSTSITSHSTGYKDYSTIGTQTQSNGTPNLPVNTTGQTNHPDPCSNKKNIIGKDYPTLTSV